jgi:hypothetical protein
MFSLCPENRFRSRFINFWKSECLKLFHGGVSSYVNVMKQFLSHNWASCIHLTAHCLDLSSRQPSQCPQGSCNSWIASSRRQNTTSFLSVRHAWSGLKHGIDQSRHPPRIGLLRRFATLVLLTCFLNLLADRPLFTLILLTGRIIALLVNLCSRT